MLTTPLQSQYHHTTADLPDFSWIAIIVNYLGYLAAFDCIPISIKRTGEGLLKIQMDKLPTCSREFVGFPELLS